MLRPVYRIARRLFRLSLICSALSCAAASLNAYADKVVIGTVQYEMQGDLSKGAFLKKINGILASAVENQANILVFPEWNTLDLWPKQTKASDQEVLRTIAKTINENYLDLLQKHAKTHRMIIVGGTLPLVEGGKIFNAAPVILEDGQLHYHRKIHLTKWERDTKLSPGDKAKIFKSKYGTFTVLVCYDSEFPDLSKELMAVRPEMILVPSMTESPAGVDRVRWSTQARVVEHTAYGIIAVTNGKVSQDWQHFGRAAVISPRLPALMNDSKISERDGHLVIFKTIDLQRLRKERQNSPWQPALDIGRRKPLP